MMRIEMFRAALLIVIASVFSISAFAEDPAKTALKENAKEVPKEQTADPAVPAFMKSIDWSGDVRVREELRSTEARFAETPNETRLLFRLGANAKINPSADAEFRVASNIGPTATMYDLGRNPTSGSTTENEGFRNMILYIDRAFLHWNKISGLDVYAGRVKNVLYASGGNDLLYDWDLNFDGLSATYDPNLGSLTPFVNFNYFWVTKSRDTSTVSDAHLMVPQIGLKKKGDGWLATLGVSLHYFSHLKGNPPLNSARQNTYVGGKYAEDFRTGDLGSDVTFNTFTTTTLFVNYVKNLAVSTQNEAFIAGFKLGSLKKKGGVQLIYDYRHIKANAMVSDVPEGDVALAAGTNYYAHRSRLAYQIDDGITVSVLGALAKVGLLPGQTALARNVYQLDVAYVF